MAVVNTQLEDILARVKEVVGAKNDAQVAKALEVDPSNIPTWRRRGTIPYEPLATFAHAKGVSLNWLLHEHGAKLVFEGDQEQAAFNRLREENLNPGAYGERRVDSTASRQANEAPEPALPDRELLQGCIEALEDTKRYPDLGAKEKARAIVALYELSVLQGEPPKELLRGAA